MGHCFFRRPFFHHLFLSPRTIGPRNFWLNAQFLLNYLQLSFLYYLYDSQYKGFRLKPTLKILKLKQYSRRLICFLPSLNITKAIGQNPNNLTLCYKDIIRHLCLDPYLGPCPTRLIRSTLHCGPMTSIVWQDSSLGSCLTFPSPNTHYNSTFGSFDLVSSPIWCEVETNIENLITHCAWCRGFSLSSLWDSPCGTVNAQW